MAVRTPSETIDAAESAGIAKNSRPLGRLLAGSALAGAYIALGGTLSLLIGFETGRLSGSEISRVLLHSRIFLSIYLVSHRLHAIPTHLRVWQLQRPMPLSGSFF